MKGDFEVQAPATGDPAEVGPCDFVLFCVKTLPIGEICAVPAAWEAYGRPTFDTSASEPAAM